MDGIVPKMSRLDKRRFCASGRPESVRAICGLVCYGRGWAKRWFPALARTGLRLP